MWSRRMLVTLILTLVILGQAVIAGYVEWADYKDSITFNGVSYPVLDARGCSATKYNGSSNIPVIIYAGYYVENATSGLNESIIRSVDENDTEIELVHVYSTQYLSTEIEGIDVSPSNDYVAMIYNLDELKDGDAALVISDLNLNYEDEYVYDGYNATINFTRFYGLYASQNGVVYVVGYIYDSKNNIRYGLLGEYIWDGSSLQFNRTVFYSFNDPDGISNNLSFTDVLVGPDGYLYVAGYIPYIDSQGNVYDYKGEVLKINPKTLDVVAEYVVQLYNSNGYVGAGTVTGNIAADDSYIYYQFNTLSNIYPYTRAVLFGKLDTSLNPVWTRLWDNKTSNELGYDLAVTQLNLSIIGLTDNNYGITVFNYSNAAVLSLDPATGDPKYLLLVGGNDTESFTYSTIDPNGYLYTLGTTNTQPNNLYEAHIPAQYINVSTLSTRLKNIGGIKLYPSGETIPFNKNKAGARPLGNPSTTSVLMELGRKESSGKLVYIHGKPVVKAAERSDPPGLLVKYSVPAGLPSTPPPPIPEDRILVLAGVLSMLILSIVYYNIKTRR